MNDAARETTLLAELDAMLNDVLSATAAGASYGRITRAQGYVDGYMRALEATGAVDKNKILALVARARTKLRGPATKLGDESARFHERRSA